MRRALIASWLRTFLVQASFNFDRMVGLGWAWAAEPLLRALPGGRGGAAYQAAMQRATRFFNAHPYLAGMAVGAVARAERDGVAPAQVERLRHALVGPLGSVGDKLIWAGAMPASVGLGLLVAAQVSPVAGAVVFLIGYNAAHLALRSWALREGWRRGTAVSAALTAGGIKRGMRLLGPVGALLVGLAIPVLGGWLARDYVLETKLSIALVGALGVAFAHWILPAFRGLRFGLVAAAVALLVGWLS
jgi:PTS system mannose-specific IID component